MERSSTHLVRNRIFYSEVLGSIQLGSQKPSKSPKDFHLFQLNILTWSKTELFQKKSFHQSLQGLWIRHFEEQKNKNPTRMIKSRHYNIFLPSDPVELSAFPWSSWHDQSHWHPIQSPPETLASKCASYFKNRNQADPLVLLHFMRQTGGAPQASPPASGSGQLPCISVT